MTRRTLTLLAFLLSASVVPALAKHHFGRVLLMGKFVFVFDDIRILFHGGMTAGDFFHQLERRETPNGTLFLLNSRQISTYPRSVDVNLFADEWTDQSPEFDNRYSGTAAASMGSLQFKAEWKRGLQTRPVSGITISSPQTVKDALWNYQLTVPSDGIPLTDHLIISVYGADSSLVARFSGAP